MQIYIFKGSDGKPMADGRQFLSSVELEQLAEQERLQAEQAKQQLHDMQALLQQYRDRFGELDS